ncbi:hypothetical protein D3C81_1105970 [compost metagenome]
MLTFGVSHDDFGGVAGEAVGQNRDEGAAFTAGEHCVDDRPAVSAEHAAVVAHGDAGGALHGEVDQLRWIAAQGRVLAVAAHGADHVVTLFRFGNQPRDFFRRVLQVGVEGDHHIAFALFETGHDCCVLAVVTVEDDRHERAVFTGRGFFQKVGGLVTAAVVDEDNFKVVTQHLAGGFSTAQQFRQAVLFVVDRDDDRHTADRIGFHGRLSIRVAMAPTTRSRS